MCIRDRAATDEVTEVDDLPTAASQAAVPDRDLGSDAADGYEPTTPFSRLRGPFDRSEVEGLGDYLDPVSYTHLDVYKRQTWP